MHLCECTCVLLSACTMHMYACLRLPEWFAIADPCHIKSFAGSPEPGHLVIVSSRLVEDVAL